MQCISCPHSDGASPPAALTTAGRWELEQEEKQMQQAARI